MAEVEGIVGNARQGIGEGASDVLRMGKTGCLVVGTAHGEFYEAVSRGRCWAACTATSGVAPGTALGTTSAFYIHNPVGSGVNLVLIAASLGYISGTFGAGAVFATTHAGVSVANPTGTSITPRNLLLGGNASGAALAFTTATVTTQVAIRPLWSFGAILATSVFQPTPAKEQLNGEIVVAPGFGFGIHSVATAGTSPLCVIGATWEEVPIS
jgi:hypothetical protein